MTRLQPEDSETLPTHQADAAQLPATLERIVLTGFMGSGKSTVGRLLADRLGWAFVDLDELIALRAGLSVSDIFALHGEAHFRRLESSALAAALGRRRIVLALGGGTPESLTNRLLLEQTPATATLLLDAPFPILFDRCVLQAIERPPDQGPDRPILADPAQAEARFTQRQPIYRRLARHTVDSSCQSPDDTVADLIRLLTR